MRRYILSLLLMFFTAVCCSAIAHASSKSDNIDLAVENLAKAVKSERENSKRRGLTEQILMKCKYGGCRNIGREGIDAIASLLEDNDDLVRLYAADALGFIGPPAKYTLPLLKKALNKEEQEINNAPGFGLRTGIDSTDIIPSVIEKINR